MSQSVGSSGKTEIRFTVNGKPVNVRAYPMARLLDVLREELGLTGTKEGCGEGECGSCAIMMGETLVNSCLVPALQADGTNILTIEGLAADGRLTTLQQTFLEYGGAQCGICTPGMLLAAQHLLSKKTRPSLEDVREGLSGNLCRCTGYMQIFEAVMEAGRRDESSPSRI
ncbi:MAG TPA: (2Fe-2S)-binding protein [Candidatus Eremiobacteraceae bacterium]|nr:(2Fe-2S)-binding protein [Candidatus Eremiobacteraceae bacterium]